VLTSADDNRAFDEDRILGHRAQHLVVRRGVAEAERRVWRLAAPHDLDRTDAEHLHDPAQLINGQRIAEVLPHRQLDGCLADEFQRRAALAAAWVMKEDVGHV